MYKIRKRIVISAAHYLTLDYNSKCSNMHGHNWVIEVFLRSKDLDQNGMVMDFTQIKEKVKNQLDHKLLNDVLKVNPTAENIAKWVQQQLGEKCYRVIVEESPNNVVTYETDDENSEH